MGRLSASLAEGRRKPAEVLCRPWGGQGVLQGDGRVGLPVWPTTCPEPLLEEALGPRVMNGQVGLLRDIMGQVASSAKWAGAKPIDHIFFPENY